MAPPNPSAATPLPTPPVLMFDDGSRAMMQQQNQQQREDVLPRPESSVEAVPISGCDAELSEATNNNDRLSTLFEERYEMDRVAREIRRILFSRKCRENAAPSPSPASGVVDSQQCQGIALQFPEPWLADAWLVCHELERRLALHLDSSSNNVMLNGPTTMSNLLVYCVGDASSSSSSSSSHHDGGGCCPDVVSARHVPNTRVLVQYGPHRCSSSPTWRSSRRRNDGGRNPPPDRGLEDEDEIRVLQVHGRSPMSVPDCVRHVRNQLLVVGNSASGTAGALEDGREMVRRSRRLVVLYDPRYHHAMEELQTSLSEQLEVLVVMGQLPGEGEDHDAFDDGNGGDATIMDVENEKLLQETSEVAAVSCLEDPSSRLSCCEQHRPPHNSEESRDGAGCGVASAESSDVFSGGCVHDVASIDADKQGDAYGSRADRIRLFIVGGLELPWNALNHSSAPPFSVVYVGDATSAQFFLLSLRLHAHSKIVSVITFDPEADDLAAPFAPPVSVSDAALSQMTIHPAGWSPACSRFLKRRYYLVQKLRSARAVGIVAADLGGGNQVRQAIRTLFGLLIDRGRSPYLYSVGKEVNVAKLSNFADSTDCFVVMACPHRTLRIVLELDRECAVPVVTPMEAAVALDCIEWGRCRLGSLGSGGQEDSSNLSPWNFGYSVDLDDFLDVAKRSMRSDSARAAFLSDQGSERDGAVVEDGAADDEDDDAPYFSLVTGRYESQIAHEHRLSEDPERDLSRLPGQGVLTTYHSTAAEALKQRQYRGLRPEIGSTAVRVALPGQHGIASDYGNR